MHRQGPHGATRIFHRMVITSRHTIANACLATLALVASLPAITFAKPPVAIASPTPRPTATATPSPQARARTAYDSIAQGTFDRSQLTPALDAELTASRLAGYARVLGPLGAPRSFTLAGTHVLLGTTTYDFIVRYGEGAVVFTYAIDAATQRVSKLYVRTARS